MLSTVFLLVHASNGYLINQFIDSSSNQRTDAWGGSVEKRAKFVLELLKECVAVFGEGRVGIKFSPCGGYNDMGYFVIIVESYLCSPIGFISMPLAETLAQYSYILTEANKLPLAYICLARWSPMFETHYDGTYTFLCSIFNQLNLFPQVNRVPRHTMSSRATANMLQTSHSG